MRIPYRIERARIPRPMVDVDIVGQSGGVISTDALVDSGSDFSLFDMTYARMAGATLYPQLAEHITGVSGGMDAVPGALTVRILGHRFRLRAHFAENIEPNLLGRGNFFRVFHVCFDERNQEIELRYRRRDKNR